MREVLLFRRAVTCYDAWVSTNEPTEYIKDTRMHTLNRAQVGLL